MTYQWHHWWFMPKEKNVYVWQNYSSNILPLFLSGFTNRKYIGNIWKITLPPCLFVQPIAAQEFTIYLFDTHTSFYATFKESWCVEHYSLWYTAQSYGTWSGLPPIESQLIAVEEHCCYQGLLGAGWGWWQYAKFSPHGSLRETGGQHPILEVYYFHIS